MSDGHSQNTRKGRSLSLHLPKRSDPTPVPPSLTNSPHLSSPHSIFRQKLAMPKTPSQEDDEWLRDMVPMNSGQSTFDEILLRTSSQVQKKSQEESSGRSSSRSSFQGHATLSPRPHMHRSWSSPTTRSNATVGSSSYLTNGQERRGII
ncbi:hypothetical protein BDR04DRAFT_1087387 [Suillus decipiens]|nr:hypothetical protein BDR04DRAFT_1087387 [Suillus decipiens]